jgi:hypothetical protein
MNHLTDYPLLVLAIVFLVLWLSARIGSSFLRRQRNLEEEVRENFGVILAATLTLLGLIIGFSFSMAISRYDQRKIYEEAEANAISTEYIRADLMPVDGAKVRALLRNYLDQRILFYKVRDEQQLRKISNDTSELQSELWSTVKNQPAAQPTGVFALVISGMNDVLNSQGYTQAAWWNRIPLVSGLGFDGSDRHLLQFVNRLWCAKSRSGRNPDVDSTACGVDLVLSHRGHRQSTWRPNSRATAKFIKLSILKGVLI